jgi:hypothetical protein
MSATTPTAATKRRIDCELFRMGITSSVPTSSNSKQFLQGYAGRFSVVAYTRPATKHNNQKRRSQTVRLGYDLGKH